MPYGDRFILVEDYLAHVDVLIENLADPFVEARYTGFIATSAVTAYELAIKDIFYQFAEKKHAVLGSVTREKFSRLNGRIKLKELKHDHVKLFGQRYLDRFSRYLVSAENAYVRTHSRSPLQAYNNVITWRHQFVHDGTLPSTTNYAEIKDQYAAGKEVIHCLSRCMVR